MARNQIVIERKEGDYAVLLHDQASAAEFLRSCGAMDQLCRAILDYAKSPMRTKEYQPELLKRLIKQQDPGWKTEVRVPPFSSEHDGLPSNERFDMLRFASDGRGRATGVGVEIEVWEVNNDLLKIRRGVERGQIGVGVIILKNPANLEYVISHLPVNGALFSELRVAFMAPDGPGFGRPGHKPPPPPRPFLFPPSASKAPAAD